MMRFFFYILLILNPVSALSQDNVNGKVCGVDNKPIPYASIGYYGKKIGSLTDSNGRFSIVRLMGDSIKVSALGYKPETIVIHELTDSLNVSLKNDYRYLEEVIIGKRKKTKSRREIGHYSSDNRYWNYLAPQLQEAVYIPNEEHIEGYIDEIRFKLAEFRNKKFLLRIRILDVDSVTGLPSRDLLFFDNIILPDKLRRENKLSVKDKNIRLYANQGVFISFEWLPRGKLSVNEKTPYILGNVLAAKRFVMNNYKETGWHLKESRSLVSGGYTVPNVSIIVAY